MDLERKAVSEYRNWMKHLKDAREKSGIKQRDIADALKQSIGYVNKFENAKVLPSVKTLFMYLIANKFDLSVLFSVGTRGINKPANQVRKEFVKKVKELDEDVLFYLVEMSDFAEKLKSASVTTKTKRN